MANILNLVALSSYLLISPAVAFAHGGGQDSNGGHVDRSTGVYHCHSADCVLPTIAEDTAIKVTSFNIQFLGNFKNRDEAALAAVVSDQDIVVIQELVAPPFEGTFPDNSAFRPDVEAARFFDEMALHGFDFVLSDEDTGTGDSSHVNSTATEWFVTFYKPEKVDVADDLPHGFLAADRYNNDHYERVPYAFSFRASEGNDFVLISVHLQPGASNDERRLEELTAIYGWIDDNDASEKDFIILGDMNIEDCGELQVMLAVGYSSLNSSCLPTNTNVRGPKPYDHVFHKGMAELQDGFEVIDLIEAMRVPWAMSSNEAYPGEPYNHNGFRVRYSDHHPVSFRINSVNDDD